MKTVNKSVLATLLIFSFSLSTVVAQNDTMYIMKFGKAVAKFTINKEVDSVIFYKPTVVVEPETFTDSRDDMVYKTVKIGDQVWMAENLKYLPSVVGPETGSETTPLYYVYGYNGTDVNAAKATSNYNTYGVLYNWTAAMAGSASSAANPSGVQGVCPTGWHLPSDAEWTELTDYLGESEAADKLKEAGDTHWNAPTNADSRPTNITGFTALPGGARYPQTDGFFSNFTSWGFWWSATEYNATNVWYRLMNYSRSEVTRAQVDNNKGYGFSVRCVKD